MTFIRRPAFGKSCLYSAKSGSLRAVLAENMVASISGTALVGTFQLAIRRSVSMSTRKPGTSFAPLARLVQPGNALNLQTHRATMSNMQPRFRQACARMIETLFMFALASALAGSLLDPGQTRTRFRRGALRGRSRAVRDGGDGYGTAPSCDGSCRAREIKPVCGLVMKICAGQPIPKGYTLDSITSMPGCQCLGFDDDAYVIRYTGPDGPAALLSSNNLSRAITPLTTRSLSGIPSVWPTRRRPGWAVAVRRGCRLGRPGLSLRTIPRRSRHGSVDARCPWDGDHTARHVGDALDGLSRSIRLAME